MNYPKTAEDWWKSLLDNRTDLRSLVGRYYPIGAKSSPEVEISASRAEAACEVVRAKIAANTLAGFDPVDAFDKAVDSREAETVFRILNSVWFGIPESLSSRSLPGFMLLCDLCSESDLVLGD